MGRRRATRQEGVATERSVRLRALLSAGMVLGLGAVGTLAAWTDESTATATFSAGTIDLKLRSLPDGTLADTASLTNLSTAGMYPGMSKAGMVSVSNSGTVPLSYTLAGAGTGQLGSALRVSVYAGGTATNDAAGGTCSGTSLAADASLAGTLISPARALPAASAEDLCLLVKLPTTAVSTLQGVSTTATFTFNGSTGG